MKRMFIVALLFGALGCSSGFGPMKEGMPMKGEGMNGGGMTMEKMKEMQGRMAEMHKGMGGMMKEKGMMKGDDMQGMGKMMGQCSEMMGDMGKMMGSGKMIPEEMENMSKMMGDMSSMMTQMSDRMKMETKKPQ